MWKKLKIRYGLTDYQIALLRYLLFTFLSESSKLFFILFLYRRHLALCIATLLFLCCIRRTAGGFHCNTYAGCLFVSTGYAFLCLTLLPLGELIEYGDTEQLFSMPKQKKTEDYITGRFG